MILICASPEHTSLNELVSIYMTGGGTGRFLDGVGSSLMRPILDRAPALKKGEKSDATSQEQY